MKEEIREYTSVDDTPEDDQALDAGNYNVYWRSNTGQCTVATRPPGAVHHVHGPDSWQGCWAYVNRACRLEGGCYKC